MTPREVMLEVVERNEGMALALARAVRQLEGWSLSDGEARKRIVQCLRGSAGRHFCVDWIPIFAGLCVDFDDREPVTGCIDEARRDREYQLRQERRQMISVRPTSRGGKRSAAG